jgi:hypothetical protein
MDNEKKGSYVVDSSDWITIESAKQLVKSGEWIFFGNKLHEDIGKLVKQRLEDLCGNVPGARIDYAARMLVSAIEEIAEDEKKYAIPNAYDPLDPKMSAKLGFGRILKITPTLRKLQLEIFGLLGTVLAVSEWNKLTVLATACSVALPVANAVKALSSAWETLSDNEEIVVFETVALLQNSLIIGDHVSFEAEEYKDAFKYLTPELDDITDFIRSDYPERNIIPKDWLLKSNPDYKNEVLKVLNKLSDREILRERSGQWSIVF